MSTERKGTRVPATNTPLREHPDPAFVPFLLASRAFRWCADRLLVLSARILLIGLGDPEAALILAMFAILVAAIVVASRLGLL